MVVTCDIQFENNPQGCFFAGQVLSGKIILSADKIKQVKAVVLKIKGFAHTSWSEKDSKDKHTYYRGHIDYINSITQLLSQSSSDTPVIIEPGVHSFSFACHIPTTCPSSFEGNKGHIRYLIQVDLVRPWKFDQSYTRGFTVLKVMDLNYDTPLLKMPVNNQMSKVFCCGPMKTDPLQIEIHLPQSGYVPGQLIPISIVSTNDTKVPINEICVRLVMMVCLYSQTPTKKAVNEYITVSKLKGDSVPILCKKQFNYLLPVPATPPTCFNLCQIIQVAYRIEVEAKMKGIFYPTQVIHIPVTIGNVPLINVIQQQPMAATNGRTFTDGENADVVDGPSRQPWAVNDNIPCPSFEEAVHMPQGKLSEIGTSDYGDKTFTPKYPVFNIPSPSITDGQDNAFMPPTVTDPNKSTWL
ncbi:arrestin domain-containing protein 17-like [Musca vetustissima]|uniref:arrestin domain-containing protein 17-like n=1 Tax=Musca vetustissima TaxID=27455 RepID=UPI002AB7BEDA|nr:arrestin domain-containing protein 17-like [Musca vetustissima]